jgi:FG-GAP-like repeat/FG-GAP repeat
MSQMNQHRVFALVVVGALLIAEASLRRSSDQAGGSSPADAIAEAGAAPEHDAISADAVVANSKWSAGIASRIEREEYRVSQTAGGLQAPNRAHNLRTHFRQGGIDVGPRKSDEGVENASWQLTWQTTRWGRANQLTDIESPNVDPRLEGERVTYAKGAIDEWYENRKEGLEQGFTVHKRLSGEGPLIVAGNFGGGLRPQLSQEEGAIDLLDEHGALVLRYGGLHVWDADGTELPSHLELDGVEVALVIEDEGADYPLTIDPLLTSPAWTGEANQALAGFGTSVATAGDVNGDGFSDVIVGAWLYDNGEADEGRAFVYLGSALGLSLSPAWTAESNQAASAFGYSVATAGDVNGDGFSDVIVGAFKYDNGQTDEGRAFVYHGSPSGLDATPAWTAESDQASGAFGLSAATAGDVNGDGFSDVIVGALAYDNGEPDEGRAFVYHGSAAGLGATAVWTAEANQATTEFGATVATAGDVNGDGFSDVIIGASVYDNGQSDEGRAFVYHGSAAGLGATAAWTAESDQANARLGNAVATAGDVNGDGFSDVIVGVWQYDNVEPNEGRAYVYHGSGLGLATTPAWSAESNLTTTRYGYSVATAGDVNGDGFADVIVGANEFDNGEANEGRAFVYHGSAAGLGFGTAWTAEPNQASAWFGTSVATAGDVNGDGFSDVIVGAHLYDNGEPNEGRAFVYLGSADEPELSASWTTESNQDNARYGGSVATAGDVNGDGFSDVIVGADDYDDGQTDEGQAYVYVGSTTGLSTTPAWTAQGDQDVAQFGSEVASAGDVNGDGFSDVIVGADFYTNGQDNEGRAYVYHGSTSGLSASPQWIAEGNQALARFGVDVATAGDVNGDGFSDVIVGADFYSNGQSTEGRAFVYLGSPEGLASSPAWTAESDQAGAFFGASLGTAGDVNGDGISDVIIGASRYDNDQINEGRAYVYLGSPAGLATFPAWTVEGNQEGTYFGLSVGTAGDVNADGFSDVIVGAMLYDNGQSDEGQAFVYLGSPAGLATTPAWTADSNQPLGFFGRSVETAGDVNDDGFSDVIIGAYSYDNGQAEEGRSYVYLGSPAGLAASPAWTAEGNQAGAFFGFSGGTAGDVNGDGFSDVIVGAYNYDNVQTIEGRAFVYYGNGGDGLHRVPSQLRTDGATPIQVLGRSDSPTAFRLEALGRTPAGRDRVQIQYEVEPFDTPFDGAGLGIGPILDTGVPTPGTGSTVAFSELASGLNPETLYRWRLRFISNSPFFPRTPWFSLAANGHSEADVRTAASAVTGVALASPGASAPWLEPCAPNPFTIATRLSYALPDRGRVRLAVYDVSGREIAVLADDVHDSGRYSCTWDGHSTSGRRVPAGVYFARLEVGGRVEAEKIVLAR